MKPIVPLISLAILLGACGERAPGDVFAAAPEAPPTVPTAAAIDSDTPIVNQRFTGDLGGMEERRLIRVLTVYGPPRYFVERGRERGATFELFRAFEQGLNERRKTGHVKVHLVFVPVARDELFTRLLDGRGDIVAAELTITEERQQLVDFSEPVSKPMSEILVTGPAAPELGSIEDLAGRAIAVRASSSYRSSLEALNQRFQQQGLAPIELQDASEYLEDDDLLEMVNAGLLPWVVVDDYKAEAWAGVFDDLVLRPDLVFRQGGRLGFAIRKGSPDLMAALNDFVRSHRQGTLLGNILVNRYVRDFDWARNALGAEDYQRFANVVGIFEQYGNQYGIDYLLVTAQSYQESQLDHSRRSPAGAVGIMQLLPSTAADPNVGIPDIESVENNIHAGVKYLDFIRNRYFSDPAIHEPNRTLFALASYNAGPARVADLRRKAQAQGYDPNRWFDNVEVIAAREIGRETVQYVANITKYYLAYRLSTASRLQRGSERARQGMENGY